MLIPSHGVSAAECVVEKTIWPLDLPAPWFAWRARPESLVRLGNAASVGHTSLNSATSQDAEVASLSAPRLFGKVAEVSSPRSHLCRLPDSRSRGGLSSRCQFKTYPNGGERPQCKHLRRADRNEHWELLEEASATSMETFTLATCCLTMIGSLWERPTLALSSVRNAWDKQTTRLPRTPS